VAESLPGDVVSIPVSDDLAPVRVEVAFTPKSNGAAVEVVKSLAESDRMARDHEVHQKPPRLPTVYST
jgi:uncharacterized phosphosugar-binding protein